MDNEYSKRELDAKFLEIKSAIDTMADHQTIAHKEMISQMKMTNGRVKRLEIWKAGIIGALSVLTTLLLPILFILLKTKV